MAILHQGGLLTGRMGDKVFYIKDGKQMVRSAHTRHSYSPSEAQKAQCSKFKVAQGRVKKMLEEEREIWERTYEEQGRVFGGKIYSNCYQWLLARTLSQIREDEQQSINVQSTINQ